MPKKVSNNLGKCLMKKKAKAYDMEHAIFYHEEEIEKNLKHKNIKSTLDVDNITELL